MASENLWKIVNALREGRRITPRQVQELIGCSSKKSNHLLLHLVRAGAVENVGRHHHPEYALRPDGERAIKPIKHVTKSESVSEYCRKNWDG